MERLSDRLTDVEYAKKGLALWFNNKPEESEEFFKLRLDSTPIFAAYSFVVCMVRDCLLLELFRFLNVLWVSTSTDILRNELHLIFFTDGLIENAYRV